MMFYVQRELNSATLVSCHVYFALKKVTGRRSPVLNIMLITQITLPNRNALGVNHTHFMKATYPDYSFVDLLTTEFIQ
jgi:hypothetical protein